MEPMIVIVTPSAFGVMRKETYDRWKMGEVDSAIKKSSNLLFGCSDLVDTFLEWESVTRHVTECEGIIVGVVIGT